jgi:hypothetical protein
LRFERVDNLGAYRIPLEAGALIPSDFITLDVSRPLKARNDYPLLFLATSLCGHKPQCPSI